MGLGIFGGTFDPVHTGHLALAEKAKTQFHLEKVIFVPAFLSPHKNEDSKITLPDMRYAMVEEAIRGKPGFEMSRIEIDRRGRSYTVETLRYFKKNYPGQSLFLIMGEDSYRNLSGWREPDEIKRLAHLLVAPRFPVTASRPSEEGMSWIGSPLCPYASSAIRGKLKAGQSVEGMLPDHVLDFIRRHGLYAEKR